MGFRDLTGFNCALLAKQVWRVMSFPESLVARVLQTKYFNNSTVLEAKVSSNVSFVWRSLCSARPTLMKGLRWKVGDGERIRLCQDSFIPDIGGGAIFAGLDKVSSMKIRDFMTHDRVWDYDILSMAYGEPIANIIRDVPIAASGPDSFYWNLGPSKKFSVKSGYLAKIGFFSPPEYSSSEPIVDWNKLVWSAKIPPKCKVFLWCLLKEFVATPSNLIRHHVPVNERCDGCRCDWGSTIHVLYLYINTKHIWKESDFWNILKQSRFRSMIEVSQLIKSSVSTEKYDIWAMASYFTWLFVCGKKHDPATVFEVSIFRSEEYLKAYNIARYTLGSKIYLGVSPGEYTWQPPPKDVFRLDVDAAAVGNKDRYSFGAVIRDWRGEVKAVLAAPSRFQSTVAVAEMCALMYGIGLSLQEGLGPVMIYSKSFLTVRNLNIIDVDRGGMDEGLKMAGFLVLSMPIKVPICWLTL